MLVTAILKRTFCTVLIFYLFSTANSVNAQEQDWGALISGTYDAGYDSYWLWDSTRSVVFENDTMVRPILVTLWYPAKKSPQSSVMSTGEYFEIESKKNGLEKISLAYRNYNLDALTYGLLGKEANELDETEREIFKAYLRQPTFVMKDAPIVKNDFPVIIYHQGFGASFEDNSILAQFLARNGYIVLGSSFFAENLEDMGVDGRNQSVKDIALLIEHAANLPSADTSKVALVGHSGGAQACILAKSGNIDTVQLVVAIETTQEIFGIADTRWKDFTEPVLKSRRTFNVPLLALTTHLASFQLYDYLTHSDRYYITFPQSLNHNEFVSQGIDAGFLDRKIHGESSTLYDQQDLVNYTKVNQYILAFLNWKLGNDSSAANLFKEDSYSLNMDFETPLVTQLTKGTTNVEPYNFHSSLPITPKQTWQLARSNHPDSLVFALEYFFPRQVKNPVFNDIFAFSLISQLLEEGDTTLSKRLFQFYKSRQIPISERFISIGRFSVLMGKQNYAVKCIENLLILEPNNETAKSLLKELRNE